MIVVETLSANHAVIGRCVHVRRIGQIDMQISNGATFANLYSHVKLKKRWDRKKKMQHVKLPPIVCVQIDCPVIAIEVLS